MPPGVSWEDGACMDNLANAIHALDLVPPRLSETVAVFGCGASGLCFIQLCRLRGAACIVAVDIQDDRLEWARRLGADHVVHAKRESAAEAIQALTDGLGVDLAIETSGAVAVPPVCMRSASTGGRVLIFGVYEGLVNGVDFQDQFPRSVELVASGQIQLGSMVTHEVALDDVPPVLAAGLVPVRNDGHLKTVVMMAGRR
jgi:L-iditol 2-dehydrogenase